LPTYTRLVAIRKRTPAELREQSKQLLYEVQMLFTLGRYFETGEVDAAVAGLDRAGLPVRNAVIEAFEIHARLLIEFLTHQRNSRQATAREWAKGWSVPAAKKRDLQELRDAFSERVAHLSWKRSEFTREEQLVMTREIEDKVRPLILRFLQEADPEALCEDFVKEASLAAADVGRRRVVTLDEPRHGSPVRIQAPAAMGGTATQALSETAKQVRPPT
jgi:hypothetical protein